LGWEGDRVYIYGIKLSGKGTPCETIVVFYLLRREF